MSEPEMREQLLDLFVSSGAVKTGGPFKLAAGGESDFYVNCKKVLMHGRGVLLASQLAWLLIARKLDLGGTGWPHVAGKAEGTNSLVGGMLAVAAYGYNQYVEGAILRPEVKGHGLGGKWVTSVDMEERKLSWVVVEDVSTTGGSASEACEALMAAGQKIDLVLTVVDREEGAADRFAEAGIPFYSLLRRSDLFSAIARKG